MVPAIRQHGLQATERPSRLCAVASRSPDKARQFAQHHSIPLAFSSYGELLASGEVDAVYVPLPNSLHAEWTVRAVEAGLHVLCEKPLATTPGEARVIARAAAAAGRIVVEAFMYRHHPVYSQVLDRIRSGAIGPVVALDSEFSFLLDEPGSIVASAELGGGALADVGCYCVSFSRLIAGSEPSRVTAYASGGEVDDSMVGLLEFPNGILARFFTSIQAAERHRAEIRGTTGTILLESPWHPGEASAAFRLQRHGREDEVISVPGADPYVLQVDDFVRACTGSTPRWPIEDAIANMEVLDALRQAAGSRR
jgi:predicted dehydrogenase